MASHKEQSQVENTLTSNYENNDITIEALLSIGSRDSSKQAFLEVYRDVCSTSSKYGQWVHFLFENSLGEIQVAL